MIIFVLQFHLSDTSSLDHTGGTALTSVSSLSTHPTTPVTPNLSSTTKGMAALLEQSLSSSSNIETPRGSQGGNYYFICFFSKMTSEIDLGLSVSFCLYICLSICLYFCLSFLSVLSCLVCLFVCLSVSHYRTHIHTSYIYPTLSSPWSSDCSEHTEYTDQWSAPDTGTEHLQPRPGGCSGQTPPQPGQPQSSGQSCRDEKSLDYHFTYQVSYSVNLSNESMTNSCFLKNWPSICVSH